MSSYSQQQSSKVTTAHLQIMKDAGEKIACITAYDYTMARLVDGAGIDVVLVGDSAANVMMGYDTTLPITLDDMITFSKGTVRGVNRALVVVDLPFGYYQGSIDKAVDSAVKVMKETGAAALKLEGGVEICEQIKHILAAGIPVCGHLGLTPQSVNKFGGYGLRAKSEAESERLISDALMLQELGCFAIVLEKIPANLAENVTHKLSIPTIGIGAGPATDGQVLVVQDMLGMNDGFKPKFMRHFGHIGESIKSSVSDYVGEVKHQTFPSVDESY